MLDLLNQPAFWGVLVTLIVALLGIYANRSGNVASTIQTQGKTLADAFDEIEELRGKIREMDKREKITWGYMITLVEGYGRNNILPPEPPDELRTDPELMRLIKNIKSSKTRL